MSPTRGKFQLHFDSMRLKTPRAPNPFRETGSASCVPNVVVRLGFSAIGVPLTLTLETEPTPVACAFAAHRIPFS